MNSRLPSYRPFGTFRFLLALAVVLSHTFEMSLPEAHFLRQIGIGSVAVMAFFILSGFIITEALATFYLGRPLAFMGNRLVRIVPPYWGALIVSVLVHAALARYGTVRTSPSEILPPGVFDAANLFENALAIFPRPSELTATLAHPFYGFVRFYWAVYIELIFYGFAFLVAAVSTRLGRPAVVAAGVAAILFHVSGEYAGRELVAFPGRWGFAFAPYFLTGVCLYLWLAKRSRPALVGLMISYGLVALHFSRYVQGKIPISEEWADQIFEPHRIAPVLLILLVPVVLWRLAQASFGPAASIDWRLGNLSYPIYLNHWTVIVAAHTLTGGRGFAVHAATVAASIALSWLLMHTVETPIRPLRDRLRGRLLDLRSNNATVHPSPPAFAAELPDASPPHQQ